MNPVNMLQELMVSKKENLPLYTFECSGSQPEIKFVCTVQASQVTAVGEARNKKGAKYLAAESALLQLGHNVSRPEVSQCIATPKIVPLISSEVFSEKKNYIGELHEFASTLGVSYPIYEMASFSDQSQFKIVCKFKGLESIGSAVNKKKAKQIASYEMMLSLNNSIPVDVDKTTNGEQKLLGDLLVSPSEDQISIADVLQSPSKENTLSENNTIPSFHLESHLENEVED